ncbi:MAG: shikimate dehydrogenase [Pseudomonadota bacterium]
MTKLLGVIGDPISHSMSPLIHNGWLRDMGFDAAYEAMHVPDGTFDEALETLARRDVMGINVTLPHKHTALKAASEVSDVASKIGAANTLTYLGNRTWRADNTDAPGFLLALGDVNPDTDHVVVLGAGGSARAVVLALVEAGCRVTILNRTVAKAEELALSLGEQRTVHGSIDQYTEYIAHASIVVNTTSIGYDGKVIQLPEGDNRLFFDISYGKVSAPQLAHAGENGWRTKDGLGMLVAQAAYSFEIWFGEKPDHDAALRRCKNALKAIL